MSKPITLEYTDQRLRETIALNHEGVSIPTLLRAFERPASDAQALSEVITAMISEGTVIKNHKGRYQSVKPMSDLVVARIDGQLSNGGFRLKIEGITEDFPFPVTLSAKQARRKNFGAPLAEGNRVVVALTRHNGIELKARVMGLISAEKPFSLAGHFTRANVPTFIPYDRGVKTRFHAAGELPPPERIEDHRVSYWATISGSLDPYNPVLDIGKRELDPETGKPISHIILEKHNIPIRHSRGATRDARKAMRTNIRFENRWDLLGEKIEVVDPDDARDHDDAFGVTSLEKNVFVSLTAIADVAHYILPGTPLDRDAKRRGSSHYFEDDTVPMLPPNITAHASLIQGSIKPVIFVRNIWNQYGEKLEEPVFGLGLVSSHRNWTYQDFGARLTNPHDPEMRAYVELGDPLICAMRERMINFNEDEAARSKAEITDGATTYAELLVAAFMQDANHEVARYLAYKNIPFLSRSHAPTRNPLAFQEAAERLRGWGYDIPDHISQLSVPFLNETLSLAFQRGEAEGKRVERYIKAHLLERAHYTIEQSGHFGIGLDYYTHFTSPVRRLCDLFVGRAMHTALNDHPHGLSKEDIDSLPQVRDYLNRLDAISAAVASDSVRYYAIRDLQQLMNNPVRASLGRVYPGGHIEIQLHDRGGVSKLVSIRDLPECWGIGPNGRSLIYNNNITVREGDALNLTISAVRPNHAEWDFTDLQPPRRRQMGAPVARPGAAFA